MLEVKKKSFDKLFYAPVNADEDKRPKSPKVNKK